MSMLPVLIMCERFFVRHLTLFSVCDHVLLFCYAEMSSFNYVCQFLRLTGHIEDA